MQSRNTVDRQLGAWLLAGLSAPLAQFAGGMCWQLAALMVATCLPVCWLVSRTELVPGKWLSVVELAWLVYVLACTGRWMSGSWPSGNVYPSVPLILMVLGAVSAGRGSGTAARAGSVVFWLLALLFSIVTVAGVEQVEWKELAQFDRKPDYRLAVVLLLPALSVFLRGDKRKLPFRAMVGTGAFAIVVSVLVTGALSLSVARSTVKPLHEWVEGLSLAGTLQRFEALVSVALTMGWFALVSYVLGVAGTLAGRVKDGGYGIGVWSVAVASGIIMLSKVAVIPEILVVGSVILWVIVPITMSAVGRKKKIGISENNA